MVAPCVAEDRAVTPLLTGCSCPQPTVPKLAQPNTTKIHTKYWLLSGSCLPASPDTQTTLKQSGGGHGGEELLKQQTPFFITSNQFNSQGHDKSRQLNAFYNPDNIPIKVASSHHYSYRMRQSEADAYFYLAHLNAACKWDLTENHWALVKCMLLLKLIPPPSPSLNM